MGAKDQELLIRINGTAKQFNDEINKVKSKTKDLEKTLGKVAKVSSIAFLGLAAVIGGTVKVFSEFEKSFTNVVTLLDKTSFKTKKFEKGVRDLEKGILKLGSTTGESFETLNQGLFDLISAGVDAEESINVLTAATDLAIAGATDTATAVKALTAAITSYGDEAGDAGEISEKFFTAQKFGVTTVGALANEFNKVAGLGKTLGITFDELLAASTALTANGAKPTAQAFTEMRAVMNAVILAQSRLSNESAAVQKSLSLQNIENVGLVQALKETNEALGGDVVAMQKLLGSSEALSAALSLTGAQSKTFEKILKELGDEETRTANFTDALAVKQLTTDRAMKRLTTSAQALAILLGEALAPTINDIATSLSDMAEKFQDLDDETIQNLATVIKWAAGLAGAIAALTTGTLVILKVIIAVKALGVALAFLVANPIGLAIAAVAALTLGLLALFQLTDDAIGAEQLDLINRKLDAMKKKRAEVAALDTTPDTHAFLIAIDKEIDKTEELRKSIEGIPKETEAKIKVKIEKEDPEEDIFITEELKDFFSVLPESGAAPKPVKESPEAKKAREDEKKKDEKEEERRKREEKAAADLERKRQLELIQGISGGIASGKPQAILTSFLNRSQSIWAKAIAAIIEIFAVSEEQFSKRTKATLKLAANIGQQIFNNIGVLIEELAKDIPEAIVSSATAVPSAIESIIDSIERAISDEDLWARVGVAISEAVAETLSNPFFILRVARSLAKAIGAAFTVALPELINGIRDGFKDKIIPVLNEWVFNLGIVGNLFKDAGNFLKSAVEEFKNPIDTFSAAVNLFKDNVAKIGSGGLSSIFGGGGGGFGLPSLPSFPSFGFQGGADVPNKAKFKGDKFGPVFLDPKEKVLGPSTGDRLDEFLNSVQQGTLFADANATVAPSASLIQGISQPAATGAAEDSTNQTNVIIGFEDNAEAFLTAKQREASALGIGGI